MHGATGEGEESEPKLGTHYWPGRNNTLLIAVPDEKIAELLDLVRGLKVEQPAPGCGLLPCPWRNVFSHGQTKDHPQAKRCFPAFKREAVCPSSFGSEEKQTAAFEKG